MTKGLETSERVIFEGVQKVRSGTVVGATEAETAERHGLKP